MSIHESHVIQNIDSIPTILPDNSTSNIQQSIQTDEQSSVQTIVQKKKTSTSKETSGQRPRKKVYRSIKMSEEQRRQLQQQLWNIANTLRGKMDADDFRSSKQRPSIHKFSIVA
jgi:hypothetical protein